jgi:DeoR/GlpR family transcriptional regulator of sugar metabolism
MGNTNVENNKASKQTQPNIQDKTSASSFAESDEIPQAPESSYRDRIVARERDMSWVAHHSTLQIHYKNAISSHAVSHFLRFGQVVQMGSGTTLNALMAQITDYQKSQKTPLDLNILTTNLEIAQMGKEAAESDPKIFGSTQVIITGGMLLPSLNALVGTYAADNVRTDLIKPDIVFVGVAGIGFGKPHGKITYHFDHELETQESYATRPTYHRVVLCDHTKLGKTTRWCAGASVLSLLGDANECTILSSYPDEKDVGYLNNSLQNVEGLAERIRDEIENIKHQIKAFKQLTDYWRSDLVDKLPGQSEKKRKTQLRLRLVNIKGEVVEEVRLWEH